MSRARTCSSGRAVSARWAAVVAEVPDIGRCEVVRRPADDAVARVGRVLEGRAAVREGHRSRMRSHRRRPRPRSPTCGIVPVHDEHRRLRKLARHGAPALGDVLHLAVAVELVAEEIAEQDGASADAPDDLRQRALVHLEQPQLCVALRQQGGGDAGDEIGAGAVPRQRVALPRGSRRPSRSSSSCRSWRRRPRRPAGAASRARRSRRDRASRAACRAASCRRRYPRGATACPRHARRAFRQPDARSFRPRAYPQPTIPRTREPRRRSPERGTWLPGSAHTFSAVQQAGRRRRFCTGSSVFHAARASARKGERCPGTQAATRETCARARSGVLEIEAASTVRTRSGARAVAASSSRWSSVSCCRCRPALRASAVQLQLTLRCRRRMSSRVCSSGRRRTHTRCSS